jgi:hypothetical protein
MIKIEKTKYWVKEINGKEFPFVSQFASLAHWKFKKDAPKEYRNRLIKVVSNFDIGYVVVSEDGKNILEWSDIPEKYRKDIDYLTKGEQYVEL